MEKIIPVYKPIGFSSFDVVKQFKRESGFMGKVGHGGTLDPFAHGVLLLLLGDATKRFEEIKKWPKTYLVGIRLGAFSLTQDVGGKIEMVDCETVPISKIKEKFASISDREMLQKVSPFSAAKYKGRPLYKYAKKGVIIEKSKKVFFGNIDIIHYRWPLLTIRVEAIGGAYIRQLVDDLGLDIGCRSFVYFLEREKVGEYDISKCVQFDKFNNILSQDGRIESITDK